MSYNAPNRQAKKILLKLKLLVEKGLPSPQEEGPVTGSYGSLSRLLLFPNIQIID